MALESIMTIAAGGMSAQSVRLNTIASNLANAGSVGTSPESTYRTIQPVFESVMVNEQNAVNLKNEEAAVSVKVSNIVKSDSQLQKQYQPDHPLANEEGYIFLTDVNPVSEMANMLSASRDYRANVEIMNTTKNMISQTLNLLNK